MRWEVRGAWAGPGWRCCGNVAFFGFRGGDPPNHMFRGRGKPGARRFVAASRPMLPAGSLEPSRGRRAREAQFPPSAQERRMAEAETQAGSHFELNSQMQGNVNQKWQECDRAGANSRAGEPERQHEQR